MRRPRLRRKARVYAVLTLAHQITPIDYIVHGCSKGADDMADQWARENRVPVEKYPALWDVHGRGAGPIRNQLMVDDAKPDMVLAFPGGAERRIW